MASAIATEDVDSRDWMRADAPVELARRVIERLGGDTSADTVAEGLGRDLWIDYIADTGDDPAISTAVAEFLFQAWRVRTPDGDELELPRGDVLFFGGDTAYPVATANEIHARVTDPFNRVLEQLGDDDRQRVLMGIPGNHDWYDGLDGFARMFRRKASYDPEQEPLRADGARRSVTGRGLKHVFDWAEHFVLGGSVTKRRELSVRGYRSVQAASYFALPLAPSLSWFAVDRQLKTVDYRQRQFFLNWRKEHADDKLLVALPDPVFGFCEPSPTGVAAVRSLQLRPHEDRMLIVTGDLHHYQRLPLGDSMQVIAGGGGAFLHPAPLRRGKHLTPAKEWPGLKQTSALLAGVPGRVAVGRSGWIPHAVFLLLFAPAAGVGLLAQSTTAATVAGSLVGVAIAIVYALIGGVRKRSRLAVSVLAAGAAATTVFVPKAATWSIAYGLATFGIHVSQAAEAASILFLSVFVAALVFGAYLALLTRFGFENTQAFTALGHPGFKHSLRLRVRADGSGIDGYCIGLVDPLGDDPPVLVDSFHWSGQATSEANQPSSDRLSQ